MLGLGLGLRHDKSFPSCLPLALATNSLALNIHPHVAVFYFDRKCRVHERLARLMLSGRDIELKAVPRASDNAAAERSFAERAALMWTDAVHGVERAAHIEERHDAVARRHIRRTHRGAIHLPRPSAARLPRLHPLCRRAPALSSLRAPED